jgi:glycosyltransferase involved in cell wall biosynthesis
MLRGEEGFQRKEIGKLLHWLAGETPPEVIDLQNSLLIGLAAPLKRALGRPVCCTLQGEDLFLDGLMEPYREQARNLIRRNLRHVDAFITVSDYYRGFMIDYLGLPPDRTHVVPLGVDTNEFAPRSTVGTRVPDQPFTVGYFARIAPEKGLHVLADAYLALRRDKRLPAARLEAAGYLASEHGSYLGGIERRFTNAGLAGEFRYRGALDLAQKKEFFHRLHVFSVPSPYAEPKGLPVLEAMASGIPVVQPRHGAFPELVERTGGGLLVGTDVPALAEGVLTIWKDPDLAVDLGKKGAQGVRRHYTRQNMGDRALAVYESVAKKAQISQPDPRADMPRGAA